MVRRAHTVGLNISEYESLDEQDGWPFEGSFRQSIKRGCKEELNGKGDDTKPSVERGS